jgi:hypothetical protein
MWKELAQMIAARQPRPLARILRFIAHMMRNNPGREHFGSDRFQVRYFSASLATSMDRRNRGDPAMRSAWAQAIEDDPLPDTRRARAVAIGRR